MKIQGERKITDIHITKVNSQEFKLKKPHVFNYIVSDLLHFRYSVVSAVEYEEEFNIFRDSDTFFFLLILKLVINYF